ncbi:MAG: glutamine-hydrolyzing carbamoyl-phosphate synthase small subunit [Coriobacteriales bacterium]|jgi:carbamoyl-phosphate synthase small subunit|nr:glutamine-hydrolyzing carbamoyl-phosphate synthase small subunit [Coriobacteriales bacterium]
MPNTHNPQPALLLLEDGSAFFGRSRGADKVSFGEICFNTALEGYLEIISDASYAGEIIVLTYPQIGNYGVNLADLQRAQVSCAGLVAHEICAQPSNWRSQMSLPEFLLKQGVVAIDGLDTRALVKHIREAGTMKAGIFCGDKAQANRSELLAEVRASQDLSARNWVAATCQNAPLQGYDAAEVAQDFAAFLKTPKPTHYQVTVIDCGVKSGILRNLLYAGCAVNVVPWDTPAAAILSGSATDGIKPDGVFISNGPGDPEQVDATVETVRALIGQVPLFGICLGHQMLARACGAKTERLKFGHHAANHPVMNLLTGKVEITSQNHNFGIVFDSLGTALAPLAQAPQAPLVQNPDFGRIQLTHRNLNDGTPEGIRLLDQPAFSVQYHPEASPGPTDAHYLFSAFTRLMEGRPDYLDIDIAADRLAEWR